MRLPENVSWELNANGNRGALVLEGFDQGFDLSSAFAIIPRNRLQALVSRSSELELQLGCDCPVRAFLEQNRFLVIDISDPDSSTNILQTINVAPELPTSPFSFGELLWNVEGDPERENNTETSSPTDEPDALEQDPLAETRLEIVEETQRRLLDAYSRAAAVGLIDPKGSLPPHIRSDLDEEQSIEIYDSSEQQINEARTLGDNLRITTSKDVPQTYSSEEIGMLGGTCPDPSLIGVTDWATDEDISVQLARSNLLLYDDVGRLVEDEVLKRARLFIHFGFGAEASQTLNLLPDLTNRYPELLDLSQVMEHGFMPNPRRLHRYADCDSDYALWGVLSAEQLPDSQAINPQAALRGLEKLPGHLKAFLAAELSARFLQRDDLAHGMVAIRSLERLPEVNDTTPKLVNAKAELLQDDPAAAQETLESIISLDTPESPDAIVQLVETHVQNDTRVPADIALLAETYFFELRGAPGETEMFRTYVLASAKSKQFRKAIDALSHYSEQIDPDLNANLANVVSLEVAKSSDNVEFLELYYEDILRLETSLDFSTRVALARRLIELGFHDAATYIYDPGSSVSQSEEARLVEAELLLFRGQYRDSLAVLADMESAAALNLRARAEKRLGLYSASAATFQNAQQDENATKASWLSDNWFDSIARDHPTFGPARQVLDEVITAVEANDEMLETSAAAIEESGVARENLNQLLNNLQVTE